MAVPARRSSLSYSPLMIVLLAGLSLLAWISTYSGMLELISASSGDIGTPAKIAIAFAVFMLQGMIIYILDALFSGQLRLILYPLYIIGYIVLVLISVAFAFGFYWRFLEAGAQTTQAAGASVFEVQKALQIGESRLEQLQSTFGSLSGISTQKAEKERTSGGTCPNSRAGDGPRRRLRDADAQRFQFANDMIATRTNAVKADIADLNTDLQRVLKKDPSTIDPTTGTRTAFIEGLDRKLGLVVTRFNALRSDPQLRQIRDEFAARATQTSFPDDKGGTFICPDGQLQTALNGVVRSIDNLPDLQKPELRSVEGSEAVIEAFRRLSNTAISLVSTGKLAPSPEQIRTEQGGTQPPAGLPGISQDQAGLSDRDYIPLMIAIFVDVCILLVSVNRPFGPLFNLGRDLTYARERGPMRGVLGTFYQVFQDQFGSDKRPSPLQLIAPLQDVVFDHQGSYYAAVPLDFREENYKDWLNERRNSVTDSIFDPRNPNSLRPLETSRYISSIFAVLEGEGVVQLQGTIKQDTPENANGKNGKIPDENEIRVKLNQQGSVYAQADAFRLYRFRRGAWANLLLQTVGSTAAQEELARRRERPVERKSGWVLGRWKTESGPALPGRREEYKGDLREPDNASRAIADAMKGQSRRQIPDKSASAQAERELGESPVDVEFNGEPDGATTDRKD